MKRRKNNHLAEGEATGHYHQATSGEVFEGSDTLLLSAPKGTDITHQEHKTVSVPPGHYESDQTLEYDHAAEEAKKVED